MKALRIVFVLVLIALLAGAAWWLRNHEDKAPLTRAWGNVDTRQISLAFEASGRILELIPQEGAPVKAGEIIGKLDTEALRIERDRAQAELERAEAQASLSREGYRAEDIEAQRAQTLALQSRLELARRTYVCVEYGIESTSDATLRTIDRGHDFAAARRAVEATAARGVAVGAHFILGLPDESDAELLDRTRIINALPLATVKFHQLQFVEGTRMTDLYDAEPARFRRWTAAEYGGTEQSPVQVYTRDTKTFFDPEGKDVIAYGEVVFTTSVDEWREFTVKLDYTATDVVPTHLMIVCSASRYGDYFTGSSDSVMWVDDFELVYE